MCDSDVLSLLVIKLIDRSVVLRSPPEIDYQFINSDDQLARSTHHIMHIAKSWLYFTHLEREIQKQKSDVERHDDSG